MKVRDLIQLNEEKEVLMTLFHHMSSQAKPTTSKVSSSYAKELAEKCRSLHDTIEKILE